jgi:hypothetical protein
MLGCGVIELLYTHGDTINCVCYWSLTFLLESCVWIWNHCLVFDVSGVSAFYLLCFCLTYCGDDYDYYYIHYIYLESVYHRFPSVVSSLHTGITWVALLQGFQTRFVQLWPYIKFMQFLHYVSLWLHILRFEINILVFFFVFHMNSPCCINIEWMLVYSAFFT